MRARDARAMSEMRATLDRLERRIEDQTARIDALYRMLELRGLPRDDAGRGDALFDELFPDEDEPLAPRPEVPTRRRATRLHVGSATGV
jgi:hypothetical protein